MTTRIARESGGVHLSGSSPPPCPAWDPAEFWRIVPHVDAAALRIAVTPHPPKLGPPEEADPVGDVARVARLHAALSLKLLGERPPTANPRAAFERWKTWPTLRGGAQALREVDLAPARWVAFAFGYWTDQMGKWGVPWFNWVLNAAFVRKHAEWAREQTAGMGGQVQMTPSLRELAQLTEKMMREIHRARPPDVESLRGIVQVFFPGHWHTSLTEAAMRESDQERERLHHLLNSGGWPW